MNLRETIKEITRQHLEENNGLLFGQAVTAVGWINQTVPDCKGVIELPMCDVAGSAFAVGAAIAGRRPIFVERYQDFITLGMSSIINYAAKTKLFFANGTPMWIRLLADEGRGLGPLHSAKLHGLFLQFPGLKICAPITPIEYRMCWSDFMLDDCPYIVSEHRASFDNVGSMPDEMSQEADITLYGISIARMNMYKAQEILLKSGIYCNMVNLTWLKPLLVLYQQPQTKLALVIDSGFENGGTSQYVAYKLMEQYGIKAYALGLKDVSVGITKETENATPSAEEIADRVRCLVHQSRQ